MCVGGGLYSCVQVSMEARDIKYPETSVTGSREPPDMGTRNPTPEEHVALLTTEPSLQLDPVIPLNNFHSWKSIPYWTVELFFGTIKYNKLKKKKRNVLWTWFEWNHQNLLFWPLNLEAMDPCQGFLIWFYRLGKWGWGKGFPDSPRDPCPPKAS